MPSFYCNQHIIRLLRPVNARKKKVPAGNKPCGIEKKKVLLCVDLSNSSLSSDLAGSRVEAQRIASEVVIAKEHGGRALTNREDIRNHYIIRIQNMELQIGQRATDVPQEAGNRRAA